MLIKCKGKINKNLNFLLISRLSAGLGVGCLQPLQVFWGFGGDVPPFPPGYAADTDNRRKCSGGESGSSRFAR